MYYINSMSFPRIQSGMNADHTDGMQLPERHYTSNTTIAYGTVSHLSSTVFTNESTQLVAGIEEKYVDCMVGGGGGGGVGDLGVLYAQCLYPFHPLHVWYFLIVLYKYTVGLLLVHRIHMRYTSISLYTIKYSKMTFMAFDRGILISDRAYAPRMASSNSIQKYWAPAL